MNINKTTIQTLKTHHEELYPSLVSWLEVNVPIQNGCTPYQSTYEYLYTNWNVLGVRAQNPQKQSSYIDYIMMVIYSGDSIGYILQNPIMNERLDKVTKFFNRLQKNLIK